MSWLRRKSPQDRFADEVAGLARSLLGARVRRVPDDFALEVALVLLGSVLARACA